MILKWHDQLDPPQQFMAALSIPALMAGSFNTVERNNEVLQVETMKEFLEEGEDEYIAGENVKNPNFIESPGQHLKLFPLALSPELQALADRYGVRACVRSAGCAVSLFARPKNARIRRKTASTWKFLIFFNFTQIKSTKTAQKTPLSVQNAALKLRALRGHKNGQESTLGEYISPLPDPFLRGTAILLGRTSFWREARIPSVGVRADHNRATGR